MGRSFPAFSDLLKNERKEFDIASDLLVRFASNVLRDPQNLKYRQIKLTNEIFMNKILPVLGAIDCLFTMGFEEVTALYYLKIENISMLSIQDNVIQTLFYL